METLLNLTYLYMIVLLLALLVERIMEVVTAIWDYIEWKARMYRFWNARANKLKKDYERKAKSQILYRVISLTPLVRQIGHATLSSKKGHSDQITIVSGEMIRQATLATATRIVASIFGILFCNLAGVNLVELFREALPLGSILETWPHWIQLTVSGVIVGLGSEPVHSMIKSVEKKRKDRAQEAELKKRLSAQTQ